MLRVVKLHLMLIVEQGGVLDATKYVGRGA